MTALDILIPTYNRPEALGILLTSLCFQERRDFRIIISDQSDAPIETTPALAAVRALLGLRGVSIEFARNLPRRGLAQQRQSLLDRANAPYALFLDDDLILEPWVVGQLMDAITREGCGFVGSAPIGLSFADDHRPHQQAVEWWNEPVGIEVVRPSGPAWARHRLHNAANMLHVQQRHAPDPARSRLYKVAWVGGCTLYDRAMLRAAGGFSFWRDLPREHAGEDAHAQLTLMAHFGGAGVLPSGVYHQELPTTVPDRDCDAPIFFATSGHSASVESGFAPA